MGRLKIYKNIQSLSKNIYNIFKVKCLTPDFELPSIFHIIYYKLAFLFLLPTKNGGK